MRIGTMLTDAARALVHRPATRRYPAERQPPPPRLRSRLHWDASRCTGCRVCVMDCPADAIEVFVLDKAAKRFVFRYDAARCAFCAQCVESCNFNALSLSNDEWELAGPDRTAFVSYHGVQDDVERILAGDPGTGARQPKRS